MFRYLVSASSAVFSLFFMALVSAPAPAVVTGWWSGAVAAQEASAAFLPRRTVLRIEELAADGSVSSYEEGEILARGWGDGAETVVLRAEKNGKDASADWKKRYAKAPSGGRDAAGKGSADKAGPPPGFDMAPFSRAYAEALERGAARLSGERVEVPYSIAAKGMAVNGTAYFDYSGVAQGYEQAWTKLPLLMKSMSSRVAFARREGALVVASMEIRGAASLAFVQKRFRMEFRFSDWERDPTKD